MFKKIINKFSKQDNEVQRLLYDMYYLRVYKTAYFITKDIHLSQDILQETFIKAFNRYDDLKDKEKVGAWLSSIAARTAIDALRSKKRRAYLPLENSLFDKKSVNEQRISSVEQEVERNILKEKIWDHIDQLPSEYRVVIVLKYIHEMKDQEISDYLNIKVGTVKSRLHRAKYKMISSIKEVEELKGEFL
ncbi:RNA polymerase sigma factor [Bacillaceae bacterium IKA-2]|nr:RNA polymerase sigma factor [Bacillaceae bacterium IKA-2]